ncbi:hypothetical protein ABE073_04615 [Lederbergia citrisecunda]
MKDGLRLWWQDQKEMWGFIKRHPIISVCYFAAAIVIMKWLGL